MKENILQELCALKARHADRAREQEVQGAENASYIDTKDANT